MNTENKSFPDSFSVTRRPNLLVNIVDRVSRVVTLDVCSWTPSRVAEFSGWYCARPDHGASFLYYVRWSELRRKVNNPIIFGSGVKSKRCVSRSRTEYYRPKVLSWQNKCFRIHLRLRSNQWTTQWQQRHLKTLSVQPKLSCVGHNFIIGNGRNAFTLPPTTKNYWVVDFPSQLTSPDVI